MVYASLLGRSLFVAFGKSSHGFRKIFTPAWSGIVLYGPIWFPMVLYCPICLCMVPYVLVCLVIVPYGQVCTLMIPYGPVSCMVLEMLSSPIALFIPIRYQILADIESFAFLFITDMVVGISLLKILHHK